MKVIITPMPSCFVSILFTNCARSVSCYGCQLYGYACLPKFANVTTIFVSIDLGMSRGGVDTLVLGINYFTKAWDPLHAIVGCLN
jgi:hypothetical protein